MDERSSRAAQAAPRARLDAVETSYSDAERDLTMVLTQPILFDPTHPLAARFRAQRELARQQVEKDPESWATQHVVEVLEASWQQLRGEARRVGVSDLSWWQRRRLRRGARLLEQARSDRGSPRMRLAAYFRGLQLLEGLVDLPHPLRRDIHDAAVHTEPLRTPGPDFPTHW